MRDVPRTLQDRLRRGPANLWDKFRPAPLSRGGRRAQRRPEGKALDATE